MVDYEEVNDYSNSKFTEEENARLKLLIKPAIDDMRAWEESWTYAQNLAQYEHDNNIHIECAKGDGVWKKMFYEEQDEIFATSNTSNDGLLDRDQLRTFIELSNQCALREGLCIQEVTEEHVDMFWECFNGYNPS